jgi:membrane-bound lytic murein transglycosylase D
MLRTVILALICVASAAPTIAGSVELPRPAALEPNVRFWTRIYSEIDGNGGLLHDSRNLDVVYEVVRFSSGLSSRARERRTEALKSRIRAALRSLASGKRTGLSDEERKVLSRWPQGVANATLRDASRHLRFQLGQADKFRAGLARSGAWRDHIEKTLIEHDVPVELAALPHVESSFNPRAYSRVGAAGLWQFTRSTGRRYLRVDHVVDERMDPVLATVAAARLLRDNQQRLDAWPLAITAYNHGVSGIARAVRKLGTKDLGEISHRYTSRTFGFASRNFYAEFLAALDVDRHADQYFGPIQKVRSPPYRRVTLDHFYPATSLVSALGIDSDALREHNPALRPSIWNGAKYVPRGFELKIPVEVSSPIELATALNQVPASQRFAQQHRDRFHKVRRGETLSRIAGKYRVRESQLVALNNLRSRHRIRVGQVLILPDGAAGARAPIARSKPPTDGIYHVRRGDTLSIIATRFGVTQTQIVALNRLKSRHRISTGQALRLPTDDKPVAAARTPSAPAPSPTPSPSPRPPTLQVVADEQPPGALEPDSLAAVKSRIVSEKPATAPVTTPFPDPSDYAVGRDERITVQAEETLGHYAEWLEVSASRLRRVNGTRAGTPVVLGRKTRLDFSRVTPETFEQRRLTYHQALQEEFFEAYNVVDTESYTLKRGDTLWFLAARKFRVPVWLLRQYNPDIDFARLPAGIKLVIPRIESRTS